MATINCKTNRRSKGMKRKQRKLNMLDGFVSVYGYETSTPLKRIAYTLNESVQNIQNLLDYMEECGVIMRSRNGASRHGQTITIDKQQMERYACRIMKDEEMKKLRIRENSRKRYLARKKKNLKYQEDMYNKIKDAQNLISGETK